MHRSSQLSRTQCYRTTQYTAATFFLISVNCSTVCYTGSITQIKALFSCELFIYLMWKSYSKYSDKKKRLEIHWSTLINAKRPLRTPEGHFVPFAAHSSKGGVLGNGLTDVLIRFPIIAQPSKSAHYFHGVVGLEVINISQWYWLYTLHSCIQWVTYIT